MTKIFLAIITGAGAISALALGCGDPNPPLRITKGGSGSGGDTGSGGMITGSGGTPEGSGGVAAGSGGMTLSSGGATGNGGAVASSGGAAGTGSGGEAGKSAAAGATGAGGRASGMAGATGTAGATVVVGESVDNFDDNDGRITMTAGRQGPWHSFNDSSSGNQTPAVNTTLMPETGGANGTPYAGHTKGSGYKFGGIGFDLNNATTTPESAMSMAYDASAYKGVAFWAKGTGNLRVELPTKGFVPTARGGSCNESNSTCWNVYGSRSPQKMLTTDWKQFVIPFSTVERDDGTKTPAFDPSQLMGISFKSESDTFDFWIDEVELTK